jgi:glutathione peroxidase|tara:strand:+ start:7927 stop:8763 length:837 start_codon:yes stop_codon:yes gene_type:complete
MRQSIALGLVLFWAQADAFELQQPARRVVLHSAAASCLTLLGQKPAWSEDAAALAAPEEPPAEREPIAAPPSPSPLFDFDVPFRGEPTSLEPFIGKATIVVNVKFDDPVTLDQIPGFKSLLKQYAENGLHVLAFPTDQGWFEALDSDTLRLQFKSVYDFGQFPTAVVFDKADLLGEKALPVYKWITKALKNPWGVERIVLDYEKFLVDSRGVPVRRYPRKFPPQNMAADVQALLSGQPLPPPSKALEQAWEDAKREAVKSEYSFKPGLNYYKYGSPAS